MPTWLPHKQISLGLDLQGGSHLLLEVEVAAVISEHLETVVDSVRVEMRKARVRFQDLGIEGDSVVFRLRDPAKEDAARDVIRTVIASVSGTGGLFGAQSPGLDRREMPCSPSQSSFFNHQSSMTYLEARSRYFPSRVSIRIVSPLLIKGGTWTIAPVSIFAGL